jgi:predicted HTH domain antitoxin
MAEIEFLGARLEKEIIEMVEETAKEERVDKTKALKELIQLGRKQFLIQKYMELYRLGRCSLDKAAQAVGITVHEMMQEATKAGIKSSQSIEEYKKGLQLLE